MTKINSGDRIYDKARTHYLDHHGIFYHGFHEWLKDQGAIVDDSARQHGVFYAQDIFGVAITVDTLRFDDDHLATIFQLRWA